MMTMMMVGRRAGLAVACALLLISCVLATKRNADLVYIEPELDTAYSSDIHPYAYAYRYPEPQYADHHDASSAAHDFGSFVELQDHFVAGTKAAAKFTVTPEIVSDKSAATSFVSEREESGILPVLAAAATNAAGAKYLTADKGIRSPSEQHPMKLDPHPSPFYDPSRKTPPGYAENYRRATYGLRRRRMPFTFNALTSSVNPFRRPNSFMNTPQDTLFPRVRFLEALNPATTDYGRFGGPGKLPYNGASSFRAMRHTEPNPGSIGGFGNMAPFSMNVASPPWLHNYGSVQDPMRPRQGMFPLNVGGGMGAHPMGSGPSPYIAGSYKFFNFYGGGGGGGAAKGGGGEGG